MEEIFKKLIEKYGIAHQLDMVMEESAELIQAINKYKRMGEVGNLVEEMADMEIMLSQLRMILDCDKWIESIKVDKMDRIKKLVDL